MIAKFRVSIGIALLSLLAGCASVEMASIEQDNLRKSFSEPSDEKAGLYLYRNGLLGTAVKRSLSIDGIPVGAPAGITPLQIAAPFASVKVAWLFTPINE